MLVGRNAYENSLKKKFLEANKSSIEREEKLKILSQNETWLE